MVEELLAETKDFPIEAVAVSEGPGSYTGLRIGASVAKGLAYGLNVPLMAVPTLQIMAAQVASQVRDGLLCPMIDARRMEVYNAFYTPELKEVIPVAATIVDEHSFAEQLAAGKVYFFGNGAKKCMDAINHPNFGRSLRVHRRNCAQCSVDQRRKNRRYRLLGAFLP